MVVDPLVGALVAVAEGVAVELAVGFAARRWSSSTASTSWNRPGVTKPGRGWPSSPGRPRPAHGLHPVPADLELDELVVDNPPTRRR